MEIVFVTSNKGKFEWAKRRFANSGISLIQGKLDIPEIRDSSAIAVSKDKALTAQKLITVPFIVEDTSFCISKLKNFPGTFIKFAENTIGILGIIKLLNDESNRTAFFESALTYFDGKNFLTFTCIDKGKISLEPRGNNLRNFSEIAKIFIPDNCTKTVAEMNEMEFMDYEKRIEDEDHFVKFLNYYKNN